MKNSKSISIAFFILLSTIILSSCSRKYGCFYSNKADNTRSLRIYHTPEIYETIAYTPQPEKKWK